MRKTLNVSGQRFGKLTAIEYIGKDKNKKSQWRCLCDCGNETVVNLNNLQKGNTKSCGCLSKEKTISRNTTHGKHNTRLYRIWSMMKNRCHDEKTPCYINYGGRGISVCSEWDKDFYSFYYWSINNGYSDGLTIDRINNDGNYEPSNCRWITKKEQAYNRRTNRFIEINEKMYSVTEAAKIMNCSRKTVLRRVSNGAKIEI